jgi:RNA polymerase sigma-70 factor (ECF subfamily)
MSTSSMNTATVAGNAHRLRLVPGGERPADAPASARTPRALIGAARFEELVRRHERALIAYAQRHLRSEQDARDCVQEALTAAWRAGAEKRGPAMPARAWLLRITQRKVIDLVHQRRRELAASGLDDEVETLAAPEDATTRTDERLLTMSALSGLRPEFRAVALLRLVHGLSEAQTADRLGVPKNTVKTRLHRARRDLALTLRRETAEVSDETRRLSTRGAARPAEMRSAQRADRYFHAGLLL